MSSSSNRVVSQPPEKHDAGIARIADAALSISFRVAAQTQRMNAAPLKKPTRTPSGMPVATRPHYSSAAKDASADTTCPASVALRGRAAAAGLVHLRPLVRLVRNLCAK